MCIESNLRRNIKNELTKVPATWNARMIATIGFMLPDEAEICPSYRKDSSQITGSSNIFVSPLYANKREQREALEKVGVSPVFIILFALYRGICRRGIFGISYCQT